MSVLFIYVRADFTHNIFKSSQERKRRLSGAGDSDGARNLDRDDCGGGDGSGGGDGVNVGRRESGA